MTCHRSARAAAELQLKNARDILGADALDSERRAERHRATTPREPQLAGHLLRGSHADRRDEGSATIAQHAASTFEAAGKRGSRSRQRKARSHGRRETVLAQHASGAARRLTRAQYHERRDGVNVSHTYVVCSAQESTRRVPRRRASRCGSAVDAATATPRSRWHMQPPLTS